MEMEMVRVTRVPSAGTAALQFPVENGNRAYDVVTECRVQFQAGSVFDAKHHLVVPSKTRRLPAGEYTFEPAEEAGAAGEQGYTGGFSRCPVPAYTSIMASLDFEFRDAQANVETRVDFSTMTIKLADFDTSTVGHEEQAMKKWCSHPRQCCSQTGLTYLRIHDVHRLPMFAFVLGNHAISGNPDTAATLRRIDRMAAHYRTLICGEFKLNPQRRTKKRMTAHHLRSPVHRRQVGLTMIGAAKANKVPVVMTISDGVFWDVFRFQERFIMYNEGLSTSEAFFLLHKLLQVDAGMKRRLEPPSQAEMDAMDDQAGLFAHRRVTERTQS